jgi:hypothetical protein
VTPYSLSMPKGKDYPIQFTKDGYESETRYINRSFDTIGIVNILFPPLFLVDFATGAMFKYDPDQYSVTMTPAGSHR